MLTRHFFSDATGQSDINWAGAHLEASKKAGCVDFYRRLRYWGLVIISLTYVQMLTSALAPQQG